jgi:hypothetical protein
MDFDIRISNLFSAIKNTESVINGSNSSRCSQLTFCSIAKNPDANKGILSGERECERT